MAINYPDNKKKNKHTFYDLVLQFKKKTYIIFKRFYIKYLHEKNIYIYDIRALL